MPLASRVLVLASVAAACLVGAACGIGDPPLSSPATATMSAVPAATSAPSGSPGRSPLASAAVQPTPVPTPRTVNPPAALLHGEQLAGEPVVGALGTYTWGDQGTDAPWIVLSSGIEARAGTPLRVSLDPALAPLAWTARWAPVVGGAPGDVAASQEGSGAPALAAPDAPGPWSLQLEARFGPGETATWYWRLDVP